MAGLKKNHPNVESKLGKLESRKNQPGRIATKESQPGLHQSIFEIIAPDAVADERRRTEVYNSVRTLDDLQSALEEKRFKVIRTATYYRLITANIYQKDTKRHVNTVPEKLLKLRNKITFCRMIKQKSHLD